MKTKMKKVTSVLAASALAMTALPVCAAEEPMELILMEHDVTKYTEDQTIRKELEKKYNIKIKVEQIPAEKDAVNLRIASGDIPEILWDVPFGDYRTYVDQGVVAEIPVDMIKEYAPNYYDWLIKNVGENAFGYSEIDGKNYSMLTPWTLANDGRVLAWREDILKEVGIDAIPTTLDEMETALRTVKEQKGFAPFTAERFEAVSSIYGAYGTYLCYYEKDGEIVFGPIEEGSKEAVTLLNQWYQEGLLDPEFMINKFDNVKEKWANDQAVVTETFWWDFLPKEAFFDGRLHEVKKDVEGFANIVADPPKGPNGEMGITQANPVSNAGLCFGKQLEEQPEKMQKYLEVFNDVFDRETMDYVMYGVEGETYHYNEETGVEWIAPYDQEEKRDEYGIGLYQFPRCFNDYDLQAKYNTQPRYQELREDAQSHGIGVGDAVEPLYRPIYDEKMETLDKIYKNAHIDFITGERDLAEWDDFVNEWLSAGGEEVLQEAQTAYEGMN
jgi:putative aldouronate transport system substrate-binding protein